MRTALPIICCSLFLGLGAPASSWAQGQLGTKEELTKAYEKDGARRDSLFSGAEQPGAGDKKIAQAAANYYIWRITHKLSIDPTIVQNQFSQKVTSWMIAKNNRAFINMFGIELVRAMNDIMNAENPDPSTLIHASMMLPTMARLKQDDVGDYLMKLTTDPKASEVARLYALKALKEYLPVTSVTEDTYEDSKAIIAKRLRDAKYVDTLAKFIDRTVKVDGLPPDEVAALRFVRRDAIISLANAEAPAVSAFKSKSKVIFEGPVAPTLLRVMAKQLEPEPSTQEMIEAAIGICKLKYTTMPEYQPELGIYLVAKTLEEFIKEYKGDYSNFKGGGGKVVPRIAFRTDAKRLELALKDLTDNAKGASAPVRANAEAVKTKATPILQAIYLYNQPNDAEFRVPTFLKSLRPKTGYVFKTIKTAEIPLPADGQ